MSWNIGMNFGRYSDIVPSGRVTLFWAKDTVELSMATRNVLC
jgi:hypothetical protein